MPKRVRILVIDEDPEIRTLLRRELTRAGYRVADVEPRDVAVRSIADRELDLLLIDIDSLTRDGAELMRALRKRLRLPILALSTRGDEDTIVTTLEGGADDYVRKPFGSRELLARVENALRRRARERGEQIPLIVGDLEIDLFRRRVRSRGQDVHLPVKPYEVLRVLAENAGKVLPHESILRAVWGPGRDNRIGYLRLAIRKLRSKLEPDPAHPRHILTETRVGYRLDDGTSAPASTREGKRGLAG